MCLKVQSQNNVLNEELFLWILMIFLLKGTIKHEEKLDCAHCTPPPLNKTKNTPFFLTWRFFTRCKHIAITKTTDATVSSYYACKKGNPKITLFKWFCVKEKEEEIKEKRKR